MTGLDTCLRKESCHRRRRYHNHHSATGKQEKTAFFEVDRVVENAASCKATKSNGFVYRCEENGNQSGAFFPVRFDHEIDIAENWRRRKRKHRSVEVSRIMPTVASEEVHSQVMEINQVSRKSYIKTMQGKASNIETLIWKNESDLMNGDGSSIHQRNVNDLVIASVAASKQETTGIPQSKITMWNGTQKNKPLHGLKLVAEEEPPHVSKELYLQLKVENEKLRTMAKSLQTHVEAVHSLARQRSKISQHCILIKEMIEDMIGEDNTRRSQAIELATVENIAISPAAQLPRIKDGQRIESPVDSCTSETKILANDRQERNPSFEAEDCLNQNELISALISLTKPVGKDTSVSKNLDGFHKERNDEECDLCIELTSQTDDPDDQLEDDEQVAEIQNEECVSRQHPEPEYSPGSLHEMSRDKQVKNMFEQHRDKCSINEIDVHGFEEGIGDARRKCYESIDRGSDNQGEGDGHIDLKCGCTSQKFGDTRGILRLYQSGMLEIYCKCCTECIKGKPMTPAKFERHGGRGASKKWKESIWVVLGDQKVQFSKVKGLDAFVKRYKESQSRTRHVTVAKSVHHRDEFIQCKKCLKKRRMRCRTRAECRSYHDAVLNPDWECANYPFDRLMSCQVEEEREARQASRRCIQAWVCQGCNGCICSGCSMCRFDDCSCAMCQAFKVKNND